MKKKGNGAHFEYEDARNRNLFETFSSVRDANPGMSLDEVYRIVVDMPSIRFWVSEERAAIVISSMLRGGGPSVRGMKKEMYEEIYRRVLRLRGDRPSDSVYSLVFEVVNSPAPRFFLTPGSAKVILHKIKHGWYEERKRRLRHLFM